MRKISLNDVEIRLFDKPDTEIVFDFFQGLSGQNRYFFHPYAFIKEEAEELTGPDLENPDTRRFMAAIRKDGQTIMIGHVFFWEWTRKIPWLGISVRDEYQGMGLGKRLMEYAINDAWNHDKGGILLTTMKDNHKAQALYQRCGFETIGDDPRGEWLLVLNFKEKIAQA